MLGGRASHFIGKQAGSRYGPYWRVRVNYFDHMVHRIIWKMMTGDDPHGEIDHIDGNPQNNRWNNLRLATHVENMWNGRMRRDNQSGYIGVSFERFTWRARIKINGKDKYLGNFPSREEAAQAYEAAKKHTRGHFLGP